MTDIILYNDIRGLFDLAMFFIGFISAHSALYQMSRSAL